MVLTSPSFPTQMVITDVGGNYAFANLPAGINFTVTPTKNGDANGIGSFDASNVARFAAGLDVPTTNQRTAGDADSSGTLSSFDASLIARFVAGLPGSGNVGIWTFVPVNRTYTPLTTSQTNQNFTGILVGDPSGNWTPTGPIGDGPSWTTGDSPQPANGVTLTLPSVKARPGQQLTIPVKVGDLTNRGVRAIDVDIAFDPAVLRPEHVPVDTNGTLTSGMVVTTNADNTGRLIISAFGLTETAGAGTLINLKFTVTGTAGQSTAIAFADYLDMNGLLHPAARLNDGTPVAVVNKGTVKIAGRESDELSFLFKGVW